MEFIPAIDLLEKKVVRLVKGRRNRVKVYSDDPLGTARKWQDLGARLLHIVDLSSAFAEKDNLKIIEEIISNLNIKVEVGGGIRSIKKAERLLQAGAERVIIGTKSIEGDFLEEMLSRFGAQKVAISVDVINSFLAIGGWQKTTKIKGNDFICRLKERGIKWVIYTDISLDGTLKGPNFSVFKELASFKEINLIFSGGISSLTDLEKIKMEAPFLWGIIVGKALYEGRIDFVSAQKILDKPL